MTLQFSYAARLNAFRNGDGGERKPGPRDLFALLCAAVLLSGCILQSPNPIFADSDATPVLKSYGENLEIHEISNGAIVPKADRLKFKPLGHGYAVTDKGKTTPIQFVALRPGWWVVQMGAKPVSYALARTERENILLYPLLCEKLRRKASDINFRGEDCFASKGFSKNEFNKLIETVGKPQLVLMRPKT